MHLATPRFHLPGRHRRRTRLYAAFTAVAVTATLGATAVLTSPQATTRTAPVSWSSQVSWMTLRPSASVGMSARLASGSDAVSVLGWVKGGRSDQRLRPAVFRTDSAGRPTSLLASGPAVTVKAGRTAGWLQLPLSKAITTPGRYVAALVPQDTASAAVYSTTSKAGGFLGQNSGSTPTSQWTSATSHKISFVIALETRRSSATSPTTSTTAAPSPTTTTTAPVPSTSTSSSTTTTAPTKRTTTTTTAPAPTTTTASSSGKPGASSTGPVDGVALSERSGSFWASSNGTALRDTWVHGSVYISASNVTLDNVRVDGQIYVNFTPQGGMSSPVPSSITIHRSQAAGIFSNGFNGLTLDGVELADQQDGPHAQLFNYAYNGVTYPASNLKIVNSWFHKVLPSTGAAHIENLHLGGVQGALIKNNVFELYSPDGTNTLQYFTANLAMEPAMYGVFNRDVTIDGNWFGGGGYYEAYINAAGTNSVTNNKFSSDSPRFAGIQYPPSAYNTASLPGGSYNKFTQSGNTLDGKAVSLPGGK